MKIPNELVKRRKIIKPTVYEQTQHALRKKSASGQKESIQNRSNHKAVGHMAVGNDCELH
jgi:hypothetical protein